MPFEAWYINLGWAGAVCAVAYVVTDIRGLKNPSAFVKKNFRAWLENTFILFTSSYFLKHYVYPYVLPAVERLLSPIS